KILSCGISLSTWLVPRTIFEYPPHNIVSVLVVMCTKLLALFGITSTIGRISDAKREPVLVILIEKLASPPAFIDSGKYIEDDLIGDSAYAVPTKHMRTSDEKSTIYHRIY
ncbi:MAG: hypothetical protein QXG67_03745, partial [Candidatus Nitrosotenuis sp.]